VLKKLLAVVPCRVLEFKVPSLKPKQVQARTFYPYWAVLPSGVESKDAPN
jgi:hypothetical protein